MSAKKDQLPDFEHALGELEALVERLESGDLNLDESLSSFKRGVELTRHCQSILDQAQQTVETLGESLEPTTGEPSD